MLLSILNDDINQLERFLDSGAVQIIQIFISTLTVGISFVLVAPGIAPLAILPIPLILWASFAFQKQLAPRYADVREKAGSINSRLANNIAGVATIKSLLPLKLMKQSVLSPKVRHIDAVTVRRIAFSAAFFPVNSLCRGAWFYRHPVFWRDRSGEWSSIGRNIQLYGIHRSTIALAFCYVE